MMYDDPRRWSFTFQMLALLSRVEHLRNMDSKDKIHMLGRSIFSSRFIFGELARRNGHLNEAEFKIFNDWFETTKKNLPAPDLLVYIKTSPEIAFARMKTRGRMEEKNMNLDNLIKIHDLHESWIRNWRECPVSFTKQQRKNRQCKIISTGIRYKRRRVLSQLGTGKRKSANLSAINESRKRNTW
jgi:deoxyadenosine/deoxycytidine kinase